MLEKPLFSASLYKVPRNYDQLKTTLSDLARIQHRGAEEASPHFPQVTLESYKALSLPKMPGAEVMIGCSPVNRMNTMLLWRCLSCHLTVFAVLARHGFLVLHIYSLSRLIESGVVVGGIIWCSRRPVVLENIRTKEAW